MCEKEEDRELDVRGSQLPSGPDLEIRT